VVALVQVAVFTHHEQRGHHAGKNSKITAEPWRVSAQPNSVGQARQHAISTRSESRGASSPGDADSRLWLVIVKYLDDGRQRLVEIHVDFDKSSVQSQREYEGQRVKGSRQRHHARTLT
jgi:hypothetical protein